LFKKKLYAEICRIITYKLTEGRVN